ncbi:orotate phosphoribosyltransferase [SAR202 cluster bacterium AD-804-J14_MRT_500m]|nr:orotate phosphoribosyltransferase [SAR202 cluster bacterium AD-804-J14_MRT_500m]
MASRAMDSSQRLLLLAEERGALQYGSFTLSSGASSSYYFDGRILTLDPEGSALVGRTFFNKLKAFDVTAIGGLTLGADPIVTAVTLTSYLEHKPITGFIVRKEAKGHGTNQVIEGFVPKGSEVAIVDDVCTSGGSLFAAIHASEAAGYNVALVMVLLDRNQGGSEEIRRLGYSFHSVLKAGADGRVSVLGL